MFSYPAINGMFEDKSAIKKASTSMALAYSIAVLCIIANFADEPAKHESGPTVVFNPEPYIVASN